MRQGLAQTVGASRDDAQTASANFEPSAPAGGVAPVGLQGHALRIASAGAPGADGLVGGPFAR
eukprot:10531066-Lingulodinium_polyedra.AAC.1